MTRIFRTSFVALVFAPFLMGPSCGDTQVLSDPDFEFWCDEQPCDWTIDSGTVKPTPTWHPKDLGVELVGSPVEISQVSSHTSELWLPPRCYRVALLSDVDENATVTLSLDFDDNGSIEHKVPIDGRNWKSLEFVLSAPDAYENVRFTIKKVGEGRAVLAHLGAEGASESECGGE